MKHLKLNRLVLVITNDKVKKRLIYSPAINKTNAHPIRTVDLKNNKVTQKSM